MRKLIRMEAVKCEGFNALLTDDPTIAASEPFYDLPLELPTWNISVSSVTLSTLLTRKD